MINGINKAISFGITLVPPKKMYRNDIPFEESQSKDDWVSGYNAAVKQLGDFSWLQTEIAERLTYNGILSSKAEDFIPVPTPIPDDSPFNA